MQKFGHTLLGALLMCSVTMTAQQELPSGQIEVVKDFEVRLTETRKIRIVPQPLIVDSIVRKYEYLLMAPSPSIQYQIPEIKPLAMSQEKKPVSYPFFAKAGYGSPNSLLGALSYDRVQNESWLWGIDLHHLSANNKKIDLQKFSETQGRVNSSYLLNEAVRIDGYVDGQFEKVYFYGIDDIPANPESLKRTFNRYDVHLQLSTMQSQEVSLRYATLLQFQFDKDNLGSRESTIRLGGEIGTAISGGAYPLGIKLIADLTKLTHTEEKTLNNLLVEPFFDYAIGNLDIHLGGLALLKQNDNAILPRIELKYHLLDQLLTLKAGWRGEVSKNHFHALSSYNPYIYSRLDSINNQVDRMIYAGAHGQAGPLSFEFKAAYTRFSGMALYLQDDVDEEQFVPLYEDGSYIGIDGAVQLDILKHVTLHASVVQRFFNLNNENKPWHLPSLRLDGQVVYTGGTDTYHVSLLLHAENGVPFRTVGGTEDRLDALIDLNLHGDYYITEAIGVFAEINNILGNNRERWVNYPTVGFNAKAGILVRLP